MVIADVKKNKPVRWNKNKKKNWRKKISVSAIEDALDKKRLAERTGGPLDEKLDKELFSIEKHTSPVSNVKRKRERCLMVDKIISPNTCIPKSISKSNVAKIRRQKQRREKIIELKACSKQKSNKAATSNVVTDIPLDIWSRDPVNLRNDVFHQTEIAKHTNNVIGKAQVKRPDHLLKRPYPDNVAVNVAHPGASYNPSLDAHQELLRKENKREILKIRAEEKIERAVSVDPTKIATVETASAELLEGLFDGVENKEENENSDQDEAMELIVCKAKRQKTLKTRKKEAIRKQELREKETEWADKLRENQVFSAKGILKEIRDKDEKIKHKMAMKSTRNIRPTLSATKYKEPDHDLQLSTEIKGSLRKLKPEGDILFDRYKSLQRRCIIEPRQKFKAPRRKYRVKYQEKRSFREIEL
ncbi:ribosome biogenesis protein NOP53-like [Clavelina lepadiformis]|uniref:ribosome biogenesis protein NOP53-like n=1 Tax=Clavelina lepadiformis TaxID=159417 RepID=UPI004042FB48